MRSWLAASLVCVAAALGVGACGGDEPEQGASGGSGAATTAERATVRWGQAVYSGAYWAIYAAQSQGYFEDENLDFKLSIVPSSPSLIAAAEGGSLDIFAVAGDTGIAAIAGGADVRLIAGIQRVSALQFVAGKDVGDAKDIAGGTLGATNLTSSDALFARQFVEKNGGVSKDDYTMIAVGTFPQRAASLQAGQIDGAMLTEPWTTELESQGFPVLGTAEESLGTNFNFINIAVRKSWADEHHDVVVRFVRAYQKAVDWLLDPANEKAALALLANDTVKLSQEQAQATYDRFIATDEKVLSSELTEEDVSTAIRLAKNANVPNATDDVSAYADLSFGQEAAG
jgi:NitT/TauT family transport system substrate-binding protein